MPLQQVFVQVHIEPSGPVIGKRLASYPGRLERAVLSGLGITAARIRNRIIEKLSGQVLQVREGRLRASTAMVPIQGGWRVSVGEETSGLTGEVQHKRVVYARVHEFGALIRARNAPFLVFQTIDGRWHRTKQVTIPARPYFFPTVQEVANAFLRADVAGQLAKLSIKRAEIDITLGELQRGPEAVTP